MSAETKGKRPRRSKTPSRVRHEEVFVGADLLLGVGQPSEIVIGVVAAIGTDLDRFESTLASVLSKFSYEARPIRLSDFLRKLQEQGKAPAQAPEIRRIRDLMDAGDRAREDSERGDLLALFAASAINRQRGDPPRPSRTAFVLRSLKHPDEVKTLRRIYGPGFILLGVYSTEAERLRYLMEAKNAPKNEAQSLIDRDQEDVRPLGQQTRKTFALADAFVRLGVTKELKRLVELLFGNPYITPEADEYAMFLAYSAALRSGDLSRQVGAVVVNASGDVLASGANDVPAPGGGLYWPGPGDQRDYVRGFDSNEVWRDKAIVEILRRFSKGSRSDQAMREAGARILRGSSILDITEFGRAVHAEMEALLSCARNGVSPKEATLFTTTFPCHNCAKHIVAAGIKRVVYVEPYPKSKAKELYPDSLAVEAPQTAKRVKCEPFIGLGPRRFVDLFSMDLGLGTRLTRKVDGKVIKWKAADAQLRVPMLPYSYLEREESAIAFIAATTKENS